MIYTIIFILFIHFIADFMCQSHWMATNKSKSLKALGIHVSTYTACFIAVALVFWSVGWLMFALLNGVLHFCTDFYTSKWTSSLWKQDRYHDFFAVIGLDQFIHTTTLILTYNWLMPA